MTSVAEKLFSNNVRDAHDKLRQCIVWYDGNWGYIETYLEDFTVSFTKIGTGERTAFDLRRTDENLVKTGPYNLGMVNYSGPTRRGAGKATLFTSRRPTRRNRFGLREDNLDISVVEGSRPTEVSFLGLVGGQGLEDMLNNKYPSFVECVETIGKGDTTHMAFNKSFALRRISRGVLALNYRNEMAGEVSIKSPSITLYPRFAHLKERCELIHGCKSVSIED